MVLFCILTIVLVILTVFVALAVSAAGASAIIIFGDVIVCACIIIWLLKKILKTKDQ